MTGKSRRAWPPLSGWQVEVLRWIGDGCPDGVMSGFTYKTTAIALQNRRLVTVSKRRGVWRAEIADAGRQYLTHGIYPSQPAIPARRLAAVAPRGPAGKPPATSTTVTSDQPAPTPGRNDGVESAVTAASIDVTAAPKPKGPVDELIAAVLAAGDRLVVQRSRTGRSDYEYDQLIKAAQRYGKVPAGRRLTSKALQWPDLEIRLEPAIPGTDVSPVAVPVPEHVSRYHPVVLTFRADPRCHEVSKQVLPRALNLMHALVVEAARRGHTVANVEIRRNSYGYTSWSASRDGHVTVTVRGHSSALRFRELQTTGGSGGLSIEICGYSGREGRAFRWADRKSWRLDDKLPEVLREIEIRAAEDEHRRLQAARAAAERRSRWETAMAQAKEALTEAARAEHLLRQTAQWREAYHLRAYVAAMKTTIDAMTNPDERQGAQDWLTWADSHVATLDPLARELAMPSPPEATPDALKPFLHGWSPYGPDSQW